jgi:hypothetical protein
VEPLFKLETVPEQELELEYQEPGSGFLELEL